MRISVLAYGTHGDVAPSVALGAALATRGHSVTLGAPRDFETLAQTGGLAFVPLSGAPRTWLEAPDAREMLAAGDVHGLVRVTRARLAPLLDTLADDVCRACEGAHVVVGSSVTSFLALTRAEAIGATPVLTELTPLTPAAVAVTSVVGIDDLASVRSRWGLPPHDGNPDGEARARGVPVVHAFSRHLMPRHPSWGASHVVCGAMTLDAGIEARTDGAHRDAGFSAWLDDGPAPVYLGLGSLPVLDMPALVDLAAGVCRDAGLRAVVSAGTSGRLSGAERMAADVYLIGACRHSWLLPRCTAVVHHGGAGTVHAVLAAGVPQVICSVFSDQPFWGSLVQQHGLGMHLPFRHLSRKTLSPALAAAVSETVLTAAADIGAKVRNEGGAAAAARHIDEWISPPAS